MSPALWTLFFALLVLLLPLSLLMSLQVIKDSMRNKADLTDMSRMWVRTQSIILMWSHYSMQSQKGPYVIGDLLYWWLCILIINIKHGWITYFCVKTYFPSILIMIIVYYWASSCNLAAAKMSSETTTYSGVAFDSSWKTPFLTSWLDCGQKCNAAAMFDDLP